MIEIQRYGCRACAYTLHAPMGRHLLCPSCKEQTGDKHPMEPIAKFGPVPGTTSLDPRTGCPSTSRPASPRVWRRA